MRGITLDVKFKPRGAIRGILFGAAATGIALFALACGGSSSSSSAKSAPDTAPAATAAPSSSSSSSSSSASSSASSSSAPVALDAKTAAGHDVCPAASASKDLTGAGSSAVFPLVSKWVDDYQKQCSVKLNYQSIGSGAGLTQLIAKTVDFGASDALMTDQQEKDATAAAGPVVHIGWSIIPIAVIYNVPGVQSGAVKLDGDTLAGIFSRKIKKWDDPAIKALNSGVNLPSADIAVVHRSDGSGTTYIFTNYLSAVNAEWKSSLGAGTTVNWASDTIGGQGSEGLSGQVRQTPGAIGYVDLAYASQNNIPFAQIKNKSGAYVAPSVEGATAAATGVTIPADMKFLIVDQPGAAAYPISGFTWVIPYVNQTDANKGKATAAFLWWAIHNGQQEAKSVGNAPLSPDALKAAEAQVLKLTCGGSPCLP